MLTEKGEQIVDESHAVLETVNHGMLKDFTQEECNQMEHYFLRIVSNLEEMGVSPPEHLKRNHHK
ncbi:hypothetical protein SDC9_196789 [bioreactor metagenome]|uniref:HTH marR-type domain-containing protein n=1 Tax=bioreactor metagenome TaxID=1076179 RepID=A0A645ILH8_9ZZZZ